MASAADMRGAVDSGIQAITEGQAALQTAAEEAQQTLRVARSKYEEAIDQFAAVSDKLEPSMGILREAIDNYIDVASANIQEQTESASRYALEAIEQAQSYSAQL